MTGHPRARPHVEDADRELRFMSAGRAARLMQSGELSSREYVGSLLQAIQAGNDRLCAFVQIYAEDALAAAERADDLRARGEDSSPLMGVPYAVKDLFDVRGQSTAAQSRVAAPIATRDAKTVEQMNSAGAILLGKLALEEWGIGSPLDELPAPPARNPWNPAHTPGGSSSGCGAALAAGFAPLALGTDTGGSVRNPAALCGVVGLKPTQGLLSCEGVQPLSPSLDHVGPMARTAADCALMLDAITNREASTLLPEFSLHGVRIGHLAGPYLDDPPACEETCNVISSACSQYADLGAEIAEAGLANLSAFRNCASTILRAEAYSIHASRLSTVGHLYGRRCRNELEKGRLVSATDLRQARAVRSVLKQQVDQLLERCDFLLTAVVLGPAARLDDEAALDRFGRGDLRILFNLTGHPAVSVCAGFSREGMPLAFQMIGRRGADHMLLQVADVYQQATGLHLRHPDPSTWEKPQAVSSPDNPGART